MVRKVPEPAVQTALNTLSMIEEESTEESRRLRRLLPALAAHFAKANRYPSERQWLNLIHNARENGISLRAYFNEAKPLQKIWTYEEIAERLIHDYGQQKELQHFLTFGKVAEFKHDFERTDHSDNDTHMMLAHAANSGHLALCDFLTHNVRNKSRAWDSIVLNAKVHKQFHILHTLARREGMHAKDFFYDRTKGMDEKGYKEYEAFCALYGKFKKSMPSVRPEYFTGLENWQNVGFKFSAYLAIREILSHEIPNIRIRNRETFKATMLFQSPQRLLRFMNNWGERGRRPLERLLSAIEPPYSPKPDWKKWGNGLLKYGPDMFYPVQFAQTFLAPELNKLGHISVRETRRRIWEECFPHDKNVQEISQICFNGHISRAHFDKALKLWAKAAVNDPAPKHGIPQMDIDCTNLGLPDYRLVKFPYTDPRIMFLGHYNGCCEKIGSHFEDTVIHAVKTRESGFYVLMKDDHIRGHSWVWRGEGGQIIIDGWESIDEHINTKFLHGLTNEIARQLSRREHHAFGITDILLGLSNVDFSPQKHFDLACKTTRRIACQEYYIEAPHQWLVKRLKEPFDETYIPDLKGSKPAYY